MAADDDEAIGSKKESEGEDALLRNAPSTPPQVFEPKALSSPPPAPKKASKNNPTGVTERARKSVRRRLDFDAT